jgi:hypothetical protein
VANGNKKSAGRVAGRWAAIAGAVATPFFMSLFSYLEARDANSAAVSAARGTAVVEDKAADTKRGANASYRFVRAEFRDVWKAVDECNGRVENLEQALDAHANDRVRHRRASGEVYEAPAPPEPKARRKDLPEDIDVAQRMAPALD